MTGHSADMWIVDHIDYNTAVRPNLYYRSGYDNPRPRPPDYNTVTTSNRYSPVNWQVDYYSGVRSVSNEAYNRTRMMEDMYRREVMRLEQHNRVHHQYRIDTAYSRHDRYFDKPLVESLATKWASYEIQP